MTINFQDGSAGLFDVLGKMFYAMETIVTASGTTVRDEIEDIVTQFENVTDDLDLNEIIARTTTVANSFDSSASSSLLALRQIARDYLIEVVDDDNPLTVKTFLSALSALRTQMIAESASLDASAVGVSVAAVGSPAGNGTLVVTEKRGDGLTQQAAYAETLAVTSTFDGSTSFSVAGEPVLDQLALSWPRGSGASSTLNATSPSGSLTTSGGFDTLSTLDSNLPSGWIASIAQPGITVKMTTPEQQTIAIAGNPQAGYWLLHYTNAAGKKQTTEPIVWNAAASTVQSRLRALAGLNSVTVTESGTTPNVTHTVTFLGAGGSVTMLSTTNRMTGGSSTTEVQTVTLSNADGGTFTLSYSGQTTSTIAYNASAATTQAALEALSNIEVGDVSCSGGPFPAAVTVSFTGALAAANIALMTIDTASLTNTAPAVTAVTATAGSPSQNEIQTVTLYGSPSGGTFTMTLGGLTTAPIAYNANAATVEAALELLDSIDDVTVTGGPLPGSAVVIEFEGTQSNTAISAMTLNPASLTGGSISMAVAETTPGEAGYDEWQYLHGNGSAQYSEEHNLVGNASVTAGTFTISGESGGSWTTAAIAYNATAIEILQAIWAAATDTSILLTGSGAVASLSAGDTIGIQWTGPTGLTDLTNPTIDSSGLTGGTYSVTNVQNGTGSWIPSDNTWTLSFGGQTTSLLSDNSTAAAVEAALESLSTIGSGNVEVSGSSINGSGMLAVHFTGDLAGQNVSSLVWDLVDFNSSFGISVGVLQTGGGGTDEVQTITTTGTPSQGSFRLTYAGQQTSAIAYNANAATVEAALGALSNLLPADISCGGGPLPGTPITCTFASYLGDISLMVIDDDLIQYSNTETQAGNPGTNEVQTVTLTGSATGGTFTLTHSAATTGAISYAANAATVEAALDALGIANFSVTGSAGGPWVVTYAGALAATNVALMTGDASSATNASPSGLIVETTAGSDGSGSISHAETVAGTPQVYAGTYAMFFESDGSELTQLDSRVTVTGQTAYALNLWLTVAATAGSGVIQFSLVDGISGTVINDSQGVANTITVNVDDLTTSWQALNDLVTQPVFRLPAVVPSLVYLRMRFSTSPPSGTKVYFDHMAMVGMTSLYSGGPLAALFAGSNAYRIGDKYNITVTNDRAGKLHEWMARTFDFAANQILLPVDAGGSETIPDSVVS